MDITLRLARGSVYYILPYKQTALYSTVSSYISILTCLCFVWVAGIACVLALVLKVTSAHSETHTGVCCVSVGE